MQCVTRVYSDSTNFPLTVGKASYDMAMITRHFVCKEHENYGLKGLVLKDHPTFEPFEGMGCAHDVMEHFPNDQGHIHEEFMALGASIYIRTDGGYFANRRSTPEENLVADLTNIIYYAQERSVSLKPCTLKVKDQDSSSFSEDEYKLLAKKHIESEFGDRLEDCELTSTPENIDTFINESYKWMCIGYHKAKKRYAGMDSYDLTHMFRELGQKLNDALKSMEYGMELTASISPKNLSVKVTIHEDEYAY